MKLMGKKRKKKRKQLLIKYSFEKKKSKIFMDIENQNFIYASISISEFHTV